MDENERAQLEQVSGEVKVVVDAVARSRAFEATLLDLLVRKGVLTLDDAEELGRTVRTLIEESRGG